MSNFVNHKLLVLGGRPIGTVEIVKYAKSKGAYVIVCDYLPVDKSPAKRIADECWSYSTSDVDLISKKAKNCGVTAVITGSHEFNILKTIEVCERLKLPFYCTKQQWEICQNKIKFKELCSKFNVPTARTYKLPKYKNATSKNDIDFPVIVKPSDSSASRGISVCHTVDDLTHGIDVALKESTEKKFIIEKFLDGEEIMIFYTIQNGHSHLIGICKRFTNNTYGGDVPLPELYYFDIKYLQPYKKNIDSNVKKMFDSIGLQNCVVLLQAFFYDNNFYVFEMSLRINASQEYNLTSSLLNFNSLEMLVDYSMTGKFGTEKISNFVDPYWGGKFVCILPIVLNIGKIQVIEGINLIRDHENVVSVNVFGGDKEEITKEMFGSMNQVHIRIYIAAGTKSDMMNAVNFVNKNIKILDESCKDMVLFNFNHDQLV